jgi:urease accessory protein
MTSGKDPWRARLALNFSTQNERRSVLSAREHEGPVLVQRALYPEGPGVCHIAILHPPSGIAGGDIIDIDVQVGAGAHAALTTPGATRWYKANGREACQTVRLAVAAGGRLDWLPLESIFFEETDAVMRNVIALETGAAAVGWEISQLGTIVKPTYWDGGRTRSETWLKVDGTLLWVDRLCLDAADALRGSTTGLFGFPVHATLWCFGPKLDASQMEVLTDLMPWKDDLRGGATMISYDDQQSLYLVRSIGIHAEDVRKLLIEAWMHLRSWVLGVPGTPFRLWDT